MLSIDRYHSYIRGITVNNNNDNYDNDRTVVSLYMRWSKLLICKSSKTESSAPCFALSGQPRWLASRFSGTAVGDVSEYRNDDGQLQSRDIDQASCRSDRIVCWRLGDWWFIITIWQTKKCLRFGPSVKNNLVIRVW